MSRTKRESFDWIEWLNGFEKEVGRDGNYQEPASHKKTETNQGYANEGIWKRKAKKRFKKLRNRDDRKALNKETKTQIKDMEDL
jgi:hypothetical protein